MKSTLLYNISKFIFTLPKLFLPPSTIDINCVCSCLSVCVFLCVCACPRFDRWLRVRGDDFLRGGAGMRAALRGGDSHGYQRRRHPWYTRSHAPPPSHLRCTSSPPLWSLSLSLPLSPLSACHSSSANPAGSLLCSPVTHRRRARAQMKETQQQYLYRCLHIERDRDRERDTESERERERQRERETRSLV